MPNPRKRPRGLFPIGQAGRGHRHGQVEDRPPPAEEGKDPAAAALGRRGDAGGRS